MHKKIFLVVSIFTMFLIGSSVVKADSNKVYWKISGKSIYDSTLDLVKESAKNDETFWGGIAHSNADIYCHTDDDGEESDIHIQEYGSLEACMNDKIDEFVENLYDSSYLHEVNFINSSYYDPETEYSYEEEDIDGDPYTVNYSYTAVDLSRDNDGSVMGYLYKIDDSGYDNRWGHLNRLDIVFDGELSLNENSSLLFNGMSLEQINGLYLLNTSNVTDMHGMFYGTRNLKDVDLSNFDTRNVTDMSYLFASSGLDNVDVSSFNTSNVTDMRYMFSGSFAQAIPSFRVLDLSNFDTRNVTNMEGMFFSNENLTQIYVGNNFKTSKLTEKNTMFLFCPNLVGQAGTTYDVTLEEEDSYIDADIAAEPLPLIANASSDYAKIDEKGKPGFFSIKPNNNLNNYSASSIANQTYTGSAITPSVTVKGNSKTLVKDIDYTVTYSNNVLPGTATIIIKGINNIVGEIISTFNINALSLKTAAVSSIGEQVYTGSAIKPSLTVKYGNKTLSSSDYTVSYTNNINPGKATVTITGKGIYKDTITKYFTIIPSKPTGLKAKSQTTTSITLTWNKNGGSVTGYAIYQYNTKTKTWDLKVKTSSNTYTLKNLAVGTTYSYRVKAYKIIDGSYRYSDYSASLGTSTKTKAPTLKKLTTKSKKVTVKWSKVTRATGYEVYMKSSKNGKYSKIKTTKSLSYTKAKLKKNKTYYFKVRTYRTILGVKVYSGYSKVKSIKVR